MYDRGGDGEERLTCELQLDVIEKLDVERSRRLVDELLEMRLQLGQTRDGDIVHAQLRNDSLRHVIRIGAVRLVHIWSVLYGQNNGICEVSCDGEYEVKCFRCETGNAV